MKTKLFILFISILSFGVYGQNNINPQVIVIPPIEGCGDVTLDAGCNDNNCYEWSTGDSGVQTIQVSSSGSYSVEVGLDIDGNGICEFIYIMEYSVTIFPNPSVDLGANQQFCNGGSTILDAGNGFSSYEWGGGESTQTINVNSSGSYSVTVTDNNGCTANDNVQVTIFQPIDLSDISVTETCTNSGSATVNPTGGTSPYSFIWNDGQTTQTAIGLSPGNYTVTVTDFNGCNSTENVIISQSQYCSTLPCGDSYTNMNSYASATSVPGAVGYVITFYDDQNGNQVSQYTLPGNNPRTFFYLFSGIHYNESYNWTVQVQYLDNSGILQTGPESDMNCTISFGEPESALPCGDSYTNMNFYTSATNVHGAVGYVITFYDDQNGNQVSQYTLPGNNPRTFFYLFSGIHYNESYNWTVQVQYLDNSGNLQTGPESDMNCTISFGEPESALPCGDSYTNMNFYTSATNVHGAVGYVITFYDDQNGNQVSQYTLPGNNPRTFFYLFSGIHYNESYNWTVQVQYLDSSGNLQTGPESDMNCTISFGEPVSELPCGNTYSIINDYTTASDVFGAVSYLITFYDSNGNAVSNYPLPGNNPRTFFNLFSNITDGPAYTWTVQIQYYDSMGNVQTGPESNQSCTITFNP